MTELAELLERIDKHEDHFTIFKFTTHWKVMRGTPSMLTGVTPQDATSPGWPVNHDGGYGEIARLRPYSRLEDALRDALGGAT